MENNGRVTFYRDKVFFNGIELSSFELYSICNRINSTDLLENTINSYLDESVEMSDKEYDEAVEICGHEYECMEDRTSYYYNEACFEVAKSLGWADEDDDCELEDDDDDC